MPQGATFTYADPIPYQAALRAADVKVLITAKGNFRADLTQIDLDRLWMQEGRENLPRVFHAALSDARAPISFLAGTDQATVHHCGVEVSPGDIIVNGSGSTFHRRTSGPCLWASMSLTPEHLAAAGNAFVGRDVTVPSVPLVLRPVPAHMARLVVLHQEATQLATTAPEKLAHPEVARALEQALIHAMMACLADGTQAGTSSRWRHRSAIIKRFEELLEANRDRPMYLEEICVATGASERTLRSCCQEHLGMGPVHYLWLRRMHLAHHALMLADPATATVTEIATKHGFWEFGRFAVEYRKLFRESPSVSLRRTPHDQRIFQGSPLNLPEFA